MKLGIAVKDLGPSQLNYHLVRQINDLVGLRADVDVICFYEEMQRPCLPMNFAVMQIAEAWSFDGVMVATTFRTAQKVQAFPGPTRKLFVAWDLEWMRPHLAGVGFDVLRSVYGDAGLRLLARCQDHARVLAQAWNREVPVVGDIDLNLLLMDAK